MWHWDQGHLEYFQFDALRSMAAFAGRHDFRGADRATLYAETGLRFKAPPTHSPWRNYSRVLRLCLLVSEIGTRAEPTRLARVLSRAGAASCDEYLHFLVRAFTEPSPALHDWLPDAAFRYPLLFALKYLLFKTVNNTDPVADLDEVVGAYRKTGFVGDEDAEQFIAAAASTDGYVEAGRSSPDNLRRQARESLRVMSQISYLHVYKNRIIVSLHPSDAHTVLKGLLPIVGPRAPDRESEIRRVAALFDEVDFLDYSSTIVAQVEESGFREGNKVKKNHVTIERNSRLRRDYFAARPTSVCDVCSTDTALTYPWTDRVLDLHHLLPLSSGTRVEATGTIFADLVPVCPSCHGAVHRYYDRWLKDSRRQDFDTRSEAVSVYDRMKSEFPGFQHA